MNKFTFLTFLLLIFSNLLWAQTEGKSQKISLNIAKEVKPPIFEIVSNVSLHEPSGNNAIDANENCSIIMTVKNVGIGDGVGLTAIITATGTTSGLKFNKFTLPNIKVNETKTIEFPIYADMNTMDGSVEFIVKIDEPLGFGTENQFITVQTKKFVSPFVEMVDYTVTGNGTMELKKVKPFDLQILIQNTQYGLAENVKINIKFPENVFMVSGHEMETIGNLKSGEQKSLVYTLIVNNNYINETIPIKINITEKYGKYSKNSDIVLKMNQQMAANKIVLQSKEEKQQEIVIASLRSDVDKNIPQNKTKYPNRFALIIGNEDYHSFQPGLQSESDVTFAINDATSFKEYCINLLGVEEKNVIFLTNASSASMKQAIAKFTALVGIKGAESELIFYYAGHGFPDENSKEPYLIPVDVSGNNLESAIKLYDLYNQFTATNAGKITVFLDACFSGGGRDAGLMAARGIKVTPKQGALMGNFVVFASTQGDQVALPYQEKQHGMFTYFLLKKLQDSKGVCTYNELYDYVKNSVIENSIRVNSKRQEPMMNLSPKVSEEWGVWKFIK